MTVSQRIAKLLEEEDATFVASVPCKLLDELIQIVETDERFTHVPVTREEEGIGLCAGVALTGKFPVILMQNSGIGNSINALESLTLFYGFPVLLLLSHRGTKGEKIKAQFQMGEATPKLLDAMEIDYQVVGSSNDVEKIRDAIKKSKEKSEPVAVLLPFSFWEENK